MNAPESNPCAKPIRSPSLSTAPARVPARAAAKRHARGEDHGSSRRRSANAGPRASGGLRVARGLDVLAASIELMGLGGGDVAVGAGQRPERGKRPLGVGDDAVEDRGVL